MRKASITSLLGAAALSVVFSYAGQITQAAHAYGGGENEVVLAWNERAYEMAYAEDQFFTFKGHRALSMMHLAVHDALNAIEPRYERYACAAEDTAAHPVVAAAQAAYEVLVSQYPDRRAALQEERAVWLGPVPDGHPKRAGIALGRRCARVIMALREGDAWDLPGTYAFRDEPGRYQTSGSWDGFVLQPGFRLAEPFVLSTPDQFRPPPPPLLGSAAYAAAFDEVKAQGAAGSAVRTDDQTGYAVWWMEFAEGCVNRLARRLAKERHLDLWTANRMLAYLNVALYDGYIAVWDSKYEYDHWRPITAIRNAGEDGNAGTALAAGWEPLRPTPPFPDYVSAHAAACAASFGVLERTFGDRLPFTMETNTAPPDMPIRSFDSFTTAAEECADSRIQLGWHFRYAADEGLALGRRVAAHVLDEALRQN